MASIRAYICAVYLEYILTIHFVRPYPNLLTLYVQYTKTLTVKKWLPFELICAVYLEYIIAIHFVCPHPNLLTLHIQWWLGQYTGLEETAALLLHFLQSSLLL